MTWLFLALLGVAWMAITLPAALRGRRRTPLPSAEGFKRKQALLNARTASGRWVLVLQSPGGRVEAVRRRSQAHRRRMFVALLCASGLSAAVAAIQGGALWEVHLALDACLGIYVALLIDAKKRHREPSKKVSQLAQRRSQAPPPLEQREERVLKQAVGHFGSRRG